MVDIWQVGSVRSLQGYTTAEPTLNRVQGKLVAGLGTNTLVKSSLSCCKCSILLLILILHIHREKWLSLKTTPLSTCKTKKFNFRCLNKGNKKSAWDLQIFCNETIPFTKCLHFCAFYIWWRGSGCQCNTLMELQWFMQAGQSGSQIQGTWECMTRSWLVGSHWHMHARPYSYVLSCGEALENCGVASSCTQDTTQTFSENSRVISPVFPPLLCPA